MDQQLMYRYDDVLYAAPLDEFETPIGKATVAVELRTYNVIKKTPKGVWLETGRFVLGTARKRFAWPTPELAMESFLARKRRQLSILRAQQRNVESAISLAERRINTNSLEISYAN